jgi:hypothetical protein
MMTLGRTELVAETTGNDPVHNESVAKSVALTLLDPELVKIVESWPSLSDWQRLAIQSILASENRILVDSRHEENSDNETK